MREVAGLVLVEVPMCVLAPGEDARFLRRAVRQEVLEVCVDCARILAIAGDLGHHVHGLKQHDVVVQVAAEGRAVCAALATDARQQVAGMLLRGQHEDRDEHGAVGFAVDVGAFGEHGVHEGPGVVQVAFLWIERGARVLVLQAHSPIAEQTLVLALVWHGRGFKLPARHVCTPHLDLADTRVRMVRPLGVAKADTEAVRPDRLELADSRQHVQILRLALVEVLHHGQRRRAGPLLAHTRIDLETLEPQQVLEHLTRQRHLANRLRLAKQDKDIGGLNGQVLALAVPVCLRLAVREMRDRRVLDPRMVGDEGAGLRGQIHGGLCLGWYRTDGHECACPPRSIQHESVLWRKRSVSVRESHGVRASVDLPALWVRGAGMLALRLRLLALPRRDTSSCCGNRRTSVGARPAGRGAVRAAAAAAPMLPLNLPCNVNQVGPSP